MAYDTTLNLKLFFWKDSQHKESKESFMRFAVIACVTAAGIWTKDIKRCEEKAVTLRNRKLPDYAFT